MLQIIAQILWGQAPWEHPKTAPSLLRKLGHFQTPVLQCLSRNPQLRPTMHEFKRACNRVITSVPSSMRSSQAPGFPQSSDAGGFSLSNATGYPNPAGLSLPTRPPAASSQSSRFLGSPPAHPPAFPYV